MSCRSDNLKTGVARAPHRSLLKALGFVDEEMGRPVIGIANSFNEIIPGHVGLKNIVQVDAFKSEEINMSCRSDNLKTGVARAPHRSLLKALVC